MKSFAKRTTSRLQNRVRKALGIKRVSKEILVPPISASPVRKGYLAAVAIAKNEGPYLVEWLEFHRLVGVDHIYIYDNGSTDQTHAILAAYMSAGFVTLTPWASFDANVVPQYQAYAHCLSNFGRFWRWMVFIDIDEFVFPMQASSLHDVLPAYDDLPALTLPWHMFGSSGHKARPNGLVIENYTRRARIPSSVGDSDLIKWKTIVDPTWVKGVTSPHMFLLKDGRKGAFDEHRTWVNKSERAKQASSILRLNHYFTKSEEELAAKIAKGSACRLPTDARGKDWAVVRAASIDADIVEDTAILRFVDPLRQRIAGDAGVHDALRQKAQAI
jgi:hypothetical protein